MGPGAPVLLAALLMAAPASARPPAAPVRLSHAAIDDSLRHVDANAIDMFVTNFGSFAWDLTTGNAGLFYPKGTPRSPVFAGGLWLGAQVAGEARATVAEYSFDYAPGAMLPDGRADEPSRAEYRTWKMSPWRGSLSDTARVVRAPADPTQDRLVHDSWSAYMAGAAPHGAPVRLWRLPNMATPAPGDSVDVPGPDVSGDQMLWSVFNDAIAGRRINQAGSVAPLGVEVRQRITAFDRAGALGNTVFLDYTLVNRGTNQLDGLNLSLWFDPDLGAAFDDFVGCDTSLAMGYCYNATNADPVYGGAPPAVGCTLLQGLRDPTSGDTLGLSSFVKYIGGTDPDNATVTYHYMSGVDASGQAFIDPVTGLPTRRVLTGDPVTGAGWIDSNPSDRRMMLTSGPVTMAPGDSQRVVFALVIGDGGDRLASVEDLRCRTRAVRAGWRSGYATADTTHCAVLHNCPLTLEAWQSSCRGEGPLDRSIMGAIATRMRQRSASLPWAVDSAGDTLCATLLAPRSTARDSAEREFTALVANVAAWDLHLTDGQGGRIGISSGAALATTLLANPATLEGALAPTDSATAVRRRLLDARYVNGNVDHRRALEGMNAGLGFFGGGADYGWNFFGGTLDPADANNFTSVEFRFGQTQKAYRFLRLEQADGTAPSIGRAYLYAGFHDVNFQLWDIINNRQLDAAFVERAITDAVGNLLPTQPATHDSTWGPDASDTGGREYLFAMGQAYTGSPNPATTHDGALTDDSQPLMYALWSRLRDPLDVIDPGDAFVYAFGIGAPATLDALLFQLAAGFPPEPQADSLYRALTDVLVPLDRGLGVGRTCRAPDGPLVVREVTDVQPDHIRLVWRVRPEVWGTLWAPGASGIRFVPDASGHVVYETHDVQPGEFVSIVVRANDTELDRLEIILPDLPSGLAFLPTENPARGAAVVQFTLPRRAPVRLELFDLLGRRVWSRDERALGVGTHRLTIDAALRPGLYLARLTQGARATTRRIVLLR